MQRASWTLASWPKSGRTWLRVMLSKYYRDLYGLDGDEWILFDNLHRRNQAIPSIFFTHCEYLKDYSGHAEDLRDYRDKKVVLLVRDPRDVAVSSFFQWKKRTSAYKKTITRDRLPVDTDIFSYVTDKTHGILAIVDFLNLWGGEMPHFRDLMMVRYEDLWVQPQVWLRRILEGTDAADIDPACMHAATEYSSFHNMQRRERETSAVRFGSRRLRPGNPDDPDSYKARRGKVGGYQQYFSAEQLETIDAMVSTRLDPLFGYCVAGAPFHQSAAAG